jgi:hypothetical protein
VSDRTYRIGLNEAVFRSVNEEIEAIAERFGLQGETLDLICECGIGSCAERIQLRHDDYVALRADPRTFAVVPGHEFPDVEEVVDARDGYNVVRKKEGEPARIAERTAPAPDSTPRPQP